MTVRIERKSRIESVNERDHLGVLVKRLMFYI